MMRSVLSVLLLGAANLGLAAGGYENLEQSGANVHDMASVQRGASLFMNYCHSCHSAEYMRYQRLSKDLELSEAQVEENLVFGERELTDYMIAAMPAESEQWFGKKPPDLTLTSRSRGEDWIYTFLKSFYLTDDGWNNTVLQNASMPHVLWELQGIQRPIMETYTDEAGNEQTRIARLELTQPGTMSPEEFDATIRDIAAFMIYLGEPAILARESLGIWVLLFLVVFTFLAWLLYKEYWRDVKK
jgi:ubiquinol-cytochrome c reductase cytochrome c1 subunit